ncbi:CHAP domain-containing protein [Bifidobacterium scaligerum]|uniref:CHAP domain-containing protein n=1 Tax=Bifidobacterium scaligerum TaxID=2052656 RepID=UPI0013FD5952|nr:CHAP domain-containing protein [Bifidobacterium scaligerum]
MTAFDDWVARHRDRGTDMDGYYGTQCWDLWANYATELFGAPAGTVNTAPTGANAGLAGSIWEQYPTSGWVGANFTRLPATVSPRRGDVAFWGNDPTHPVTHVAIVIQDGVHNGRIHVLAQNVDASMLARDMWDTTATDGYLRPNNQQPITGDDDMPTAQEIAEAVWNFNQNGTKCRDRLQGIDKAANDIVKTVGERVWSFPIQNVQARDRLYGLDKLQVPGLSRQLATLTATVAAQQTAIDTLAKSLGANPQDISKTVEKAVKDKLDSLQITVTTDDKEAE